MSSLLGCEHLREQHGGGKTSAKLVAHCLCWKITTLIGCLGSLKEIHKYSSDLVLVEQ